MLVLGVNKKTYMVQWKKLNLIVNDLEKVTDHDFMNTIHHDFEDLYLAKEPSYATFTIKH